MSAKAPFNATMRHATSSSQHAWHSPVPYLFGGLAAMLGLIAFALLILACSYWKLSGYLDNDPANRDLESGDAKPDDDAAKKPPQVFEEKILVIMAGQDKPTFLATPAASRTSSFNDTGGSCVCEKGTEKSPEKAVDGVTGDRSSGSEGVERV